MAAKDDKAIEAAYGKKKPLYERLCREVVVNLEELVKESGIALEVPIESRVLTRREGYRSHLPEIGLDAIAPVQGISLLSRYK